MPKGNPNLVAQSFHPLLLSSTATTQIRHRISILETLRTQGLNTPNRIRIKAGVGWDGASCAFEELKKAGLIEEICHNHDGTPLKITIKGKNALDLWYHFINALCGEIYI